MARDRERGTRTERLYSNRWLAYARTFLKAHPLCALHALEGRHVSATVVDHVTPHRMDQALFWEPSNHQGLCKRCHDRKTATEDGGFGRPAMAPPRARARRQ